MGKIVTIVFLLSCALLCVISYLCHGGPFLKGPKIDDEGYYTIEHSIGLNKSVSYMRTPNDKCSIRVATFLVLEQFKHQDINCDGITDFLQITKNVKLQNGNIVKVAKRIPSDTPVYQQTFEKMDEIFTNLNAEYLEIFKELSSRNVM